MRGYALALILAVGAAPAAAQAHADHGTQHGAAPAEQAGEHCAMMMMGGAPMMSAMHAGPGAALMQREALALTEEQVTRLEALKAEMHATVHPHMEAAKGADEAAAAEHVTQAQTAATAMVEATAQVLTPEQQEKLAAAHAGMAGMNHEGMKHEGMQHGAQGGMNHEGMQHGEGAMQGMMQQCMMMMHGGAGHGGL